MPQTRYRFLVVTGVSLIVAFCIGLWVSLTMNTTPSVISGRVVTSAGKPVALARVYFTQGPVALPDITTLTDNQGKFALSAPVAGSYQIGCTADEFAPATTNVDVKQGQNSQIEIRLK